MDYGSDAEFKSYADCIENEYNKIFWPILGCKVRALVLNCEPVYELNKVPPKSVSCQLYNVVTLTLWNRYHVYRLPVNLVSAQEWSLSNQLSVVQCTMV